MRSRSRYKKRQGTVETHKPFFGSSKMVIQKAGGDSFFEPNGVHRKVNPFFREASTVSLKKSPSIHRKRQQTKDIGSSPKMG